MIWILLPPPSAAEKALNCVQFKCLMPCAAPRVCCCVCTVVRPCPLGVNTDKSGWTTVGERLGPTGGGINLAPLNATRALQGHIFKASPHNVPNRHWRFYGTNGWFHGLLLDCSKSSKYRNNVGRWGAFEEQRGLWWKERMIWLNECALFLLFSLVGQQKKTGGNVLMRSCERDKEIVFRHKWPQSRSHLCRQDG